MNKSRALRLATAGALLVAVGAILIPRMTSYVSTSAVVNAPLITIRSPIDGRISEASRPTAELVTAGAPLIVVEGERTDQSLVSELRASKSTLELELGALKREQATLTGLVDDLRARDEQRREHGLRWQEARVREVTAEMDAARAELSEIAARYERTRHLAESGGAPVATIERERSELAGKTADVDRLTARLDALRIDGEALQDGITIEDAAGEGSYARQRLDEVTMRLADLATNAARSEAELAAVDNRIIEASRSLAANRRFLPEAATAGVVWRVSAAAGSEVLAGDEVVKLLDCERRFIEVAVSESHFESITPGTVASIRLRGSARAFEARVDAVKGAGAKPDHPDLSSEPPQVPEGQIRVFIGLAPADLRGAAGAAVAAAFCDVRRQPRDPGDRFQMTACR